MSRHVCSACAGACAGAVGDKVVYLHRIELAADVGVRIGMGGCYYSYPCHNHFFQIELMGIIQRIAVLVGEIYIRPRLHIVYIHALQTGAAVEGVAAAGDEG